MEPRRSKKITISSKFVILPVSKHQRKGDYEIASAPSLGFEEKINAGCNSLAAAGLGKRGSRSDRQEPVWFKGACVIKERLIQIRSVRERLQGLIA
ncbi:hypothetical protein E3N88_33507 [Mikania micrantha]|uniref:Uncharacterized protein n=1 Tax=Mikania micrantha TaxID=192012 RepID=A0A5N6MC53_9ASTR|nr:hypothetical protein E3N88_33507 [Mikania micrantha]